MMKKDFLYPLRRIHGMLYERKCEKEIVNELQQRIKQCSKETIFLVFTPTHGNLGDHAIAFAEILFMKECQREFFEVTDKELFLLNRYKCMNILNGRPIAINGGGNIGTIWLKVETLLKSIIKNNPDSDILIFPNTAFFEETKFGRREYNSIKKLFMQHKHLKVCAREEITYHLLQDMGINVELIPDVVFSLNPQIPDKHREGCLLCFRQDHEKTRSNETEEKLNRELRLVFADHVSFTDTVINKRVTIQERKKEVNKKLHEFATSKLVVTDRLHGMIFAAITATPCIVIDSMSPKVRGCYEWIKELQYIRFADDAEQVVKIYEEISNEDYIYSCDNLQKYYTQLKEFIINL